LSAVLKVDYAIADLQHYLRAWAWRARQWKVRLGYPTQAPFVRIMRPVVSWDSTEDQLAQSDEMFDEIAGFIFDAIDAEVDRLPTMKRAALKLAYLREVDYAVYHSNRMTNRDARRIARDVEVELIPRMRARGVVLGGK
jgi:hypothetical protein